MSHHRVSPGQALRRFTLGSGPLKRPSDRLEHVTRILLVCVLLMGVAVALAIATTHYTTGRNQAAAEAADRHRIRAELLEDGYAPTHDTDGGFVAGHATVAWTLASGARRQADVIVPTGATAGSTVPIWIDHDGNLSGSPVSDGAVVGEAVSWGLLSYAVICVIAFGTYRCCRSLLDRSRSRRWETEWADVEPVWTRRVP